MNPHRDLLFQLISPLLLCGVAASLAACSHCCNTSYVSQITVYSKVTTTDIRGHCIAEYIAEGPVEETKKGFIFRAVERRIFEPSARTFCYPFGRPVVAIASNIIVDPAPQPAWLCQ